MVSYNEETVTYDANGNMLRGPLDGQMADFTYDCRNRLVKVETEDGAVTEYAYDAENVRLREISGDRKTVYVTDREAEYSQLLSETTYKQLLGSEVQTGHKTYIYGKGLIGSKEGSSLENLYYHYNNIGSTTEITSDEGVTIYRFAYDTYGELLSDREDIRFLYNGQFGIETEDNGLYYMRARYYNPQIKRFINRDVLEGDITDSQTLNRYSYVLGNPVSLTDPFGLCASNYWSNAGHEFLDWLGFVFDPADWANAAWYTAEGNYVMAGVSSISMVPVVGSFAGKAGKEVIQEVGQKAGKEATESAIKKGSQEAAEKEAAEQANKYVVDNASGNAGKGDTGKGNTGKGDTGKGNTGKGNADSGNPSKNDPGSNVPGKTDPASAAAGAAGAAGTAGKGGANAATSAGSKADAGKGNAGGKASGKRGNAVGDVLVPDIGFNGFDALKKFLGSPGKGKAWHHIVEQSQIGKRANFKAKQVHNVNNVIAIPSGADSIHSKISAHYSSKLKSTGNLTVRDWLATKSFKEQFDYGKQLLEEYGEVIATDSGWIFKPYD